MRVALAVLLVGLALATPGFERQEELAQNALEINPNYVPALDLLASLRILDGMDEEAEALANRIIAQRLSVREAERLTRKAASEGRPAPQRTAPLRTAPPGTRPRRPRP